MSATPRKQSPNGLLDSAGAARRLGLADVTLRIWRWQDYPHQPEYMKVGRHAVRYDPAVLDAWLDARRRRPGTKHFTGKDRSPGRQRRRPGPR
jgi:hypothetical protein